MAFERSDHCKPGVVTGGSYLTWKAEAGLPQAHGPRLQSGERPAWKKSQRSAVELRSLFLSPGVGITSGESGLLKLYIFLHHKLLKAGPEPDWPELSLCRIAVLFALGQGGPSCRVLCGCHGPKRMLNE